MYFEDARKINPADMPDIDLICGGFPCQSFSIAGKRGGFADARGTLFFEIARIAAVKRPKLNGMRGNRRIGNDVIAGPFFIVGEDGDEFRSLTDEEVKESLKRFAEPEEISQEEVENAMSAGVMFFR